MAVSNHDRVTRRANHNNRVTVNASMAVKLIVAKSKRDAPLFVRRRGPISSKQQGSTTALAVRVQKSSLLMAGKVHVPVARSTGF